MEKGEQAVADIIRESSSSSVRSGSLTWGVFQCLISFCSVISRFSDCMSISGDALILRNSAGLYRVLQLDLASFASIRQFAAEYLDLGLPLNSLVSTKSFQFSEV